jgi:hypothetical protein
MYFVIAVLNFVSPSWKVLGSTLPAYLEQREK